MNPAPADLQLLAGLRLDACDSSGLMVMQYKVPSQLPGRPLTHLSPATNSGFHL